MHTLLNNVEIDFDLSILVNAICTNASVVYVGAGASIPVGLPSWHKFLKECLERAESANPSKEKWILLNSLLKQGDFLTCAELLQKEIGPSLESYVWDTFGEADMPSPIHHAIARIPFSLAITSNYDRLLESSYSSSPNVWTWRNPEAIFRSFKQGRFAVIKVHGNVGDGQSLVLTKTQYRDLMDLNKNRTFNDSLTILLSSKTFLFVGSSLRDHDLLRLMDDAKLTFGNSFGPHFAILFEGEADQLFIQYLRDEYNIFVILCKKPSIDLIDWRTESVCSFLKVLSGKVSKYSSKIDQLIALDSPKFSLNEMVDAIISDVVTRTGSERGIVAFVEDKNKQGLILKTEITKKTCHSSDSIYVTETDTNFDGMEFKTLLSHNSLLGYFFLVGGNREKYLYNPDINDKEYYPKNSLLNALDYKSNHSETKSILVALIHSDGQKVGLVALESFEKDAYTKYHLKALKNSSILLGAAYTEYVHRKLSSKGIDPFLNDMGTFQKLMDLSRQLKPLSLSYLLYEIDYEKGIVIAKFDPDTVVVKDSTKDFLYYFHENTLITKVLSEKEERFIQDVNFDLEQPFPILSKKGVDWFQIKGAVFGVPIRVEGHTSSVLIAWSRDYNSRKGRQMKELSIRISRLAHLIANAPDRFISTTKIKNLKAYKFLNQLNKKLKKIDHGKNWDLEEIYNKKFRIGLIRTIMKSLTHPSCGIARVRLWEFIKGDNEKPKFKCIYSYTTEAAKVKGKQLENAYEGIETPASDTYCSYTISRSKENPAALIQHKSMFGEVDSNSEDLDKDPDGTWTVCPIIRRNDILGFISADNHFPSNGTKGTMTFKEKPISENQSSFQRHCIELVADILVNVLRHHRILKNKKPTKEVPLKFRKETEVIVEEFSKIDIKRKKT